MQWHTLPCTDYCKCEGGDICCSHFTRRQMYIEDDDGELDVDDEYIYTLFTCYRYLHIGMPHT